LGGLAVGVDLGFELGDAGEAALVAETGDEGDLERLIVDVRVEVEEVDFEEGFEAFAEARADAEIGDAVSPRDVAEFAGGQSGALVGAIAESATVCWVCLLYAWLYGALLGAGQTRARTA
jgi:hypothetical protein